MKRRADNSTRNPAAIAHRRGGAWDPRALQQRQLASVLAVSTGTIAGWLARGCPRSADKRYDLAAVCGWMRDGGMDLGRLPQTQVLKLLGCAKPTLADWQSRGMPRNADGTYDAAACVRWRLEELDRRVADGRKLGRMEEARIRKLTLQAENEALDLAQRRGDLLVKSAVVAGNAGRYQVLKSQLLALLTRLRQQGLPVEAVNLIDSSIAESLDGLAEGLVPIGLDPDMAEKLRALLVADAGEASIRAGLPPAAHRQDTPDATDGGEEARRD